MSANSRPDRDNAGADRQHNHHDFNAVHSVADAKAIITKWGLPADCRDTAEWPNYTPEEDRRSRKAERAERELRAAARECGWLLVDVEDTLRAHEIWPLLCAHGRKVGALNDRYERAVNEL